MSKIPLQTNFNMSMDDILKYHNLLLQFAYYTTGHNCEMGNSLLDQLYEAITETCNTDVARETFNAIETLSINIRAAMQILENDAKAHLVKSN